MIWLVVVLPVSFLIVFEKWRYFCWCVFNESCKNLRISLNMYVCQYARKNSTTGERTRTEFDSGMLYFIGLHCDVCLNWTQTTYTLNKRPKYVSARISK